MKDGLLGLSVAALVLGGLHLFLRSVDAHHPWWAFLVEGFFILVGLGLIHRIGGYEDEDEGETETS